MPKLRRKLPNLVLRTTVIAGFPGETEEQFNALLSFVKEMRFDRLGAFAYSQEEGTPAAQLPNQLPDEVKAARAEQILAAQAVISDEMQQAKIGTTVESLVEGYDEESLMYFGRTQGDAPEVDNTIYFAAERELLPGEFVQVEILNADTYELIGQVCPERSGQ